MKNTMWGLLFIVFGLIGIIFIFIFQDVTTSNDNNYYILKEATEGAMIDAFDWEKWYVGGYINGTEYGSGVISIVPEKFVESFFKRFAYSTTTFRDYKIEIFQINPEPPKVSIRVTSWTGTANYSGRNENLLEEDKITVSNNLNAILEAKGGKKK